MNLRFHRTTGVAICVTTLLVLGWAGASSSVRAETADGTLAEVTQDAFPEATADESGFGRSEALIASLTIFSLAVFVGFEVITKVPPTLHTPLMSGSNAISGITLVGAALVAGGSGGGFAGFLGAFAVALAAINVVGGFMVTDRMLSMFRKK